MNEEEKGKIKEQLAQKLAEREAIVSGKARITPEEEKRYNNLGKVILELRRKLY